MSKQLPVIIDRSSPMPLYHQLAEQLSAAIDEGQLQPGDAFENELSLAERLDLSRPTVRRAIAELVDRGLLLRRRGVGTTVASKAIHRQAVLSSLYEDLQKNGRHPATEILEFTPQTTDTRACQSLGLPFDTPLTFIERLRYADGSPIAILRNWLPTAGHNLTAEILTEMGLYEAMRRAGVRPAVAHQLIGARRPTSRERKLLLLKAGDPALTMSRVAYDSSGKALEVSDHCYRYDQYFFDFTIRDH